MQILCWDITLNSVRYKSELGRGCLHGTPGQGGLLGWPRLGCVTSCFYFDVPSSLTSLGTWASLSVNAWSVLLKERRAYKEQNVLSHSSKQIRQVPYKIFCNFKQTLDCFQLWRSIYEHGMLKRQHPGFPSSKPENWKACPGFHWDRVRAKAIRTTHLLEY